MDWLKEWIWQIAGVIVLSAVCDMIVPGGEMKKYVKLVMGLVLVVTVIRPLVNVPALTVAEIDRAETQRRAVELKSRLDEKEMFNVIKVYKEKLSKKIENGLNVTDDTRVDVKVELEVDENEKFGDITEVTLLIYTENRSEDIADKFRNAVAKDVGIAPDKVRVVMLSETANRLGKVGCVSV